MTVTYSAEVANGSRFGCFWRILCKWKGSVYKLIWRELLVYLALYFILNLIYRFGLTAPQQRLFEKVRNYFGQQSESIPMSFVLGFYVTLICRRWWEQYRLLPWPDSLALFVSAAISGQDEKGRLMRRNIVRYAMLSYVITLHQVSFRVKKRFPSWQHMVDAGLMMDSEKKIFEMMDEKTSMSKYWMPLVWATNIINRARKEKMIQSDHLVQTILTELSDIRKRLGSLIGYDTVCVPLVYTQVVTLAVYTYFIAALMGSQLMPPTSPDELEIYFPFFTVLQFCFYIGWLKVAEVLINPFGEDDDDIELNWLIDRHFKAAYMIVDEMHEEHPELLKDQYWDMVVPAHLPYTVASEHYRRNEPKGSAELLKVKESESVYANLIQTHRKNTADDVYADYESVDTPLVERRKNWFQRQLHRMGSQRSSSTTYSSGLFNRGRHNSVYSSPEAGGVGASGTQSVLQHKMSLYDRLVGRSRSGRTFKGPGRPGGPKMNGVPATLRNRPRIPTPDVTKEVVDRERTLSLTSLTGPTQPSVSAGTLVTHQLGGELPVVQVVLSPIQEMEGSPKGSQNGEGCGGSPSGSQGTAALAQAVLSPALTSAGLTAVTTLAYTPCTGSQPILTPLTFNNVTSTPQLQRIQLTAPATLTIAEHEDIDRSRKTSVASQHSAHRNNIGDGRKNGEVYV